MTSPIALDVLARIRQTRPSTRPRPGERCDLCTEAIPDEHSHLVHLETRNLSCACRACYLLFTVPGAGRYLAVPDRYTSLEGVELTEGQWDRLQIPVRIAFFFRNSQLGHTVAFYPSPAGATESLLSLDAWEEIAASHPALGSVAPDVEAVLARGPQRDGAGQAECFIVPIDACYELVGHLRRLWKGFDGGTEAREAMESFFARVRARAKPARTSRQ